MARLLTALFVIGLLAGISTTGEAGILAREIRLDPSALSVESWNGQQIIRLHGAASALAEGEPDLPMLPVHLAVPEGERVVSVRFIPIESIVVGGVTSPVPATAGNPKPGGPPAALRADILAGEGWYPARPIVAEKNGRIRGRAVYGLGVSATQWNPRTGELRLHTRFRVEAVTEPASDRSGFRVLRESPAGRRTFDSMYRRLTGTEAGVLETAESFAPLVNSGFPVEPTMRPSIDGSPVEFVIITTDDQVATYQQLADHRNRTGTLTEIRTVSWIKANYPDGVDTQETIRTFIADAVAKWGTVYVLLGGDTEEIPIRYGFTQFYGSEYIPTDLYYSDLDGTWDGDGDGVFGEGWFSALVPGDGLDLYPDAYVGRLPTSNATEAQVVVDKVLQFEQNPPPGYATDVLLLGEVLFPQEWQQGVSVLYDGASICQDLDLYIPGGTHRVVKLYENYTAFPGSIRETKSAVVDSINAGFAIVHHVGHGYINVMSVGANAATLINADVEAFTNSPENSLLYAINCTSAAIDFNCIAERCVLNANGGAFAVVGSTRLDFPTTGRSYQNEFYRLLYQAGVTRLGETFADAKIPFVVFSQQDNTHRWTQFTQLLLGDPTVDFWTADPEPLAVSHSGSFTLGQGSYAVSVTLGGAPVESAKVTLRKDGDTIGQGYTDALGQAAVPFRPDLTGSFTVGAIVHNGIAVVENATVSSPGGSPYLYATDQNVDDDLSGASIGDADGVVEAGETIELGFPLKNGGGAGESAITATLSSVDPYVSISDNLSFYPNIGPGATAAPSDPFVVTVARNAPDRHLIRCTLDVFGAVGSYSEEVILYVRAPVFDYRYQAVRDSVGNGNNNNTIAANEDFVIVPTIANMGIGSARNLQIRLRSTDPAVTITDSVGVVGTLAPGAIFHATGDGVAARLSNVTEYHELRIVLVDAYGEVYSRLVDWLPPDTPGEVLAFGSESAITLNWVMPDSGDVKGYNIYRGPTQSGPFSRINEVVTSDIAYYSDEGLPSLTRYYYQVAAVDSSGNVGPKSSAVSATTSLPLHPGWPVEVLNSTTAGITLADLNGDGVLEIVAGGEEIYVVEANGDELVNGDNDVRTLGPISSTGLQTFWNTPAVGDVDRDGVVELAAVGWNDAKLYLIDATGAVEPGWPKTVNPQGFNMPNPLGSVCLADVDADADLEIFAVAASRIFAWHHDGTELFDGDANPATSGVLQVTPNDFSYATPTVADLDGDNYKEIIVGMRDGKLYVFRHDGTAYPGFPYYTGGDITSSAAVGDIDGDGNLEIVFGSGNSLVHAIRADLTSPPGYPVGIQLQEDYDSSPALGDLNGDGRPDVVIGASNGALFAFNGTNGFVLPGFPVQIKDNLGVKIPVRSSPVLADVDGNGLLDIVVGDQLGRLHGITSTGGLLPGFPIQTGNLIENAAAIWDVDGDGLTEIVAESFDQSIYVWDTPWTFNPAMAVWPMFKKNQRNSGVADEDIFAVTGTPDARGGSRALLLQNAPNPFRGPATRISYRVPEGAPFQEVSLRVFDMGGRLVRTLLHGEQPPGQHDIAWDGKDETGRPVASGIYPYQLRVAGTSFTRKMVVAR